jgi:putative serine protease PepD
MAVMPIARKIIALGAAAVIGGAGGGLTVAALDDHDAAPAATTATVRSQPVAATSEALTAGQAYDLAKDSVAFITAQVTQSSGDPFGGAQTGEATGSGFVVDSRGYIVTNAHVVDGASDIKVKIGDGKALDATLVGKDDSTDIALLKVDAGSKLKPLALGDSERVEVGDPTYAIGNPYGLDRTLTTGVVSALQRQIQAPNGYTIDDVIQTDAALNPGNSGGPLLDQSGQVIGVNSQIESSGSSSGQAGNVGIGFAVPANTVKSVVDQLMDGGKVEHAYLGVSSGDAANGGAEVGTVSQGGPAADAGLRAGDVVTSLGGKAVADASALSRLVDAHQPGDEVKVVVRRDGDEHTLTVKLGTRPATSAAAQQQQQADPFGG